MVSRASCTPGKNNAVLRIAATSLKGRHPAWALLRNQVPIGGEQYMQAMIPHHSSAIMTSSAADIKDPEVRKLADGIIASQKKEIAQMKAILERMEK